MDKNEKSLFYSVKDLIALGIGGQNKVYTLMRSPDFPSVRIGGRLLVPKEAFWNWLKEQSQKGGEAK